MTVTASPEIHEATSFLTELAPADPFDHAIITTLSPDSARDLDFPRYKRLVYALYSSDGGTTTVPEFHPQGPTETFYVAALHPDLSTFYTKKPQTPIEAEIAQDFNQIAGFFRLDLGTYDGTNPLFDAQVLLKSSGHSTGVWPADIWPHHLPCVYYSSFSPHFLLSRDTRVRLLRQLFDQAYLLTRQRRVDNHAFIVLTTHVRQFVEDTDWRLEPIEAVLNHTDPYAHNIFTNFPTYWGKDPRLYRLLPPR